MVTRTGRGAHVEPVDVGHQMSVYCVGGRNISRRSGGRRLGAATKRRATEVELVQRDQGLSGALRTNDDDSAFRHANLKLAHGDCVSLRSEKAIARDRGH